MDGSSWRIAPIPAGGPVLAWDRPLLYFAPFVVYRAPPAGVVQLWETKAHDTECTDRRVMTSQNSDGLAYSLDEFVEFFGRAVGRSEGVGEGRSGARAARPNVASAVGCRAGQQGHGGSGQ